METRIVTPRRRVVVALGAVALALALAVGAFLLGGVRGGQAAAAGFGPAVAPPAAPGFGPPLTLPAGGQGTTAAFGDEGFVGAAATYFGIGADQLRQDLRDLGSLQAVAAKYGQDTEAGRAGLAAALETAVRAQVAGHGGTQADLVAEAFRADFARLYSAPWGQGMPSTPPTIPGMPLAPGMPGTAPAK